MVPSTESMQTNPLPSFLFQMLRDRDVNPHEVYLVPDNAAISPNPALRQAMSAPCLNRSPGSGYLGSKSQPVSFMSNARWSPNCVSPKAKGGVGLTMKSSTARALIMEALLETNETPSPQKSDKKKKKSTKKKPTSSLSSSLSPPRNSQKVRPSPHDALPRSTSATNTTLLKSTRSVQKSSSSDSLLEFIKPRRRASPTPSERRNYRIGGDPPRLPGHNGNAISR